MTVRPSACPLFILSYKPRQEDQLMTDSTAPPGQVELAPHEAEGCRDHTAHVRRSRNRHELSRIGHRSFRSESIAFAET